MLYHISYLCDTLRAGPAYNMLLVFDGTISQKMLTEMMALRTSVLKVAA